MNVKDLMDKLIQDIDENKIQNQDGRIPNETSLMKMYEVTRYAIRKALSGLAEQGLVYQVQGKGTFTRVRNHNNSITLDQTSGFTEEARRLGKEAKTIYAKLSTVTVAEANFLPKDSDLQDEEELYFVERLIHLDDNPFVLEYSYYRKKIIPYLNQEIIENSIYGYIRKAVQVNLGFADKFISCETSLEKEAKSLGLEAGDPVLILKDEAFLNTGEIFNFSKLYYHPSTQFFMLAKMN